MPLVAWAVLAYILGLLAGVGATTDAAWSCALVATTGSIAAVVVRRPLVVGGTALVAAGALTGLAVIDVPAALQTEARRMLDRFRGSKLTYVDAVSLALIESRRITEVWGTDQDLTFTGATLRP